MELRQEGLTLREIGEHLKPGKFTFTREDALKLALHDNIATLKQIAEEVSIQKDMLHRQNRNVAVLEHKLEELAATKETPPWWRRLFRGL